MIRLAQTKTNLLNIYRQSITYTRQHFQNLNIDREQIERNRKKQQQAKLKQTIKGIKSNDKNPNNYIKNLKVDSQAYAHVEKMKQKLVVNQCAIISPQPKKTPVRFSAVRKYILTTLKKATFAMRIIRKKYIYDAIAALEQSQKKVAKLMVPTLYNLVRHSMQKQLDPLRLYIHGVIVGKTMRFKGLRYHAKGKGGREQKTLCQIKIIVEQRDEKQFWQQIGSGQAPSGFAAFTRARLIKVGAGYEQLSKLGCITTAKGRQQKREIIKRKISLKLKENQQLNTFVPKKTIEKQIRAQQGAKLKQTFYGLRVPGYTPSLESREKLFKKNMGIE